MAAEHHHDAGENAVFRATYIPKESRFQRLGMLDLVPRVSEA